jgi:hypothetical protein
MTNFKTIDQVWNALDQGLTVCWASKAYEITIESSEIEWRQRQNFAIPFSNRDGKCLRVTCVSNWFGSLLCENELSNLFLK